MTNHYQVVACLDGSAYSTAVGDYVRWAAGRLEAPLVLLHAIYHRHATGPVGLSRAIGLGAQEALLEQLANHDEQTGKLALERGRLLLDATRARLAATGGPDAVARLLHGPLVDRLVELESTARLVVIGKRGASAHAAPEHLGSNLERVVRALRRPVMVAPADYREPASVMLAFARTVVRGTALPSGHGCGTRWGPGAGARSRANPARGRGRPRSGRRVSGRRGHGPAPLPARSRHRPRGDGHLRPLADSAPPRRQHHHHPDPAAPGAASAAAMTRLLVSAAALAPEGSI